MKFDDIDVQTPTGLNKGVLTTDTNLLFDLSKAVYIDFNEAFFYEGQLWGAKHFSVRGMFDITYYTLLVRDAEGWDYDIKLLKDGDLIESKSLAQHDARLFMVSIFSRTFPDVVFNKILGNLNGNVVLDSFGTITKVDGHIYRYRWETTALDFEAFEDGRYKGSDDDHEGWTKISRVNFTYRYSALDNKWVWDLVVSYVNCVPEKTIKSSVTYMNDGVSIYDREPQKIGWFKSLFISENPDPVEFKSWNVRRPVLTTSEMTYKGCSFDDMLRYLNEYD